ncbi:MAG: hypothetical protein DVB31_09315 [Verrucomicrobia bacterium]|nr:MAG: hypothetical protein DVB31_09315 [Verrucomicrobiota bacterium]
MGGAFAVAATLLALGVVDAIAIYGVVQGDRVLYFDRSHLSVAGAAVLAPLFDPILRTEQRAVD